MQFIDYYRLKMEMLFWEEQLTVWDLQPPVTQKLFELVHIFYNHEPWTIMGDKDTIKIEAFGESKVVRLLGSIESMTLKIFDNYDAAVEFITPEVADRNDAFGCLLSREELHHAPYIKLIKERKFMETVSGVYPGFINAQGLNCMSWTNFCFVDLALRMVPCFADSLVPKGPYHYEPQVKHEDVTLSGGDKLKVTLTFPGGRLSPYDEDPWFKGTLPNLPVLSHLQTKRQLLDILREKCDKVAFPSKGYLENMDTKSLKAHLKKCKINLTGCLEKADLVAAAEEQRVHMDWHLPKEDARLLENLTYTLSMLETEEGTLEAMDLNKLIFNDNIEDDPHNVMYPLLDLYMDMGLYQQVTEMMKKFGNRSIMWLWTIALLQYKKKGGKSKTAKEALYNAVKSNMWVMKYFARLKPLPSAEFMMQDTHITR